MCWVSDYFQTRAFCTMIAVAVSMIGFICLGTVNLVSETGLGYFFTFLLTFGVCILCMLPSSPVDDNVP